MKKIKSQITQVNSNVFHPTNSISFPTNKYRSCHPNLILTRLIGPSHKNQVNLLGLKHKGSGEVKKESGTENDRNRSGSRKSVVNLVCHGACVTKRETGRTGERTSIH